MSRRQLTMATRGVKLLANDFEKCKDTHHIAGVRDIYNQLDKMAVDSMDGLGFINADADFRYLLDEVGDTLEWMTAEVEADEKHQAAIERGDFDSYHPRKFVPTTEWTELPKTMVCSHCNTSNPLVSRVIEKDNIDMIVCSKCGHTVHIQVDEDQDKRYVRFVSINLGV